MLKRIILLVLLLAAGWVVLNFPYFWKNVQYEFSKDEMATTAPELAQEKIEPDTLMIESLDIRAPIQYATEVNEDKFQELLQNGVVHYPGTAAVGESGNVYIFGHSSDNLWSPGNYKSVFALLPKIKLGQSIIISDREGNKFVYKVIDARAISKDDFSVLEQNHSKKLLTLQTSYPIGTSLARYVVIAELAE